MKETTKQAAIIYFINYVSFRRPHYYFALKNHKEHQHHLVVLSKINNPRRFAYLFCESNELDLYSLYKSQLFTPLHGYPFDYYYFFKYCIQSMYEITIPYIRLDFGKEGMMLLDQLLAFSSKYPHRIKDCRFDAPTIDQCKMNTFVSLNTQSLTQIEKCDDAKLYSLCVNVKSIDLSNVAIPLSQIKVNFNQIESIELDFKKENTLDIIEFLNQMPHLQRIVFGSTTKLSAADFIAVFSTF